MNSQPTFDFKFLGNLDVEQTIKNLHTFTEEQWEEESIRQRRFKTHSQTKSLCIIWDFMSLLSGKVGKLHEKNYKQLNFDLLKPQILSICEKHYGEGELLRVLIPKLQPQGIIPFHKDKGDTLINVKRIHIPLITNENIFFTVGETTKNLKVGEMWEINNQNRHSVANNSQEERVHLIVDYQPKI